MEELRYDSVEAGENVLATEYGISRGVLRELFGAIDEAAVLLLDEYDLEDEVDLEAVTEYLKIAFAEDITLFLNEGVWKNGDGDVQRIIDEVTDHPLANMRLMVGRVSDRHQDLLHLSGAILHRAHTRRTED